MRRGEITLLLTDLFGRYLWWVQVVAMQHKRVRFYMVKNSHLEG